MLTGVGAPGAWGSITALRQNTDANEVFILGTDMQSDAACASLCDAFALLPAPEDAEYTNRIIALIQQYGIQVVLPQTTRELFTLSQHKATIQKATNCNVATSSYQSILAANNKQTCMQKALEIGVPSPAFISVTSAEELEIAMQKLGYPAVSVVVKPAVGNGSRGVKVLTGEKPSLTHLLNEKPDSLTVNGNQFLEICKEHKGAFPTLLVCEYLPGDEYTVDVYRLERKIVAIPRLRSKIRSGISFEAIIATDRKDLIAYSEKLAEELDLQYAFGFQFKEDADGVPKLLECNPRIQGTMAASALAGCNMIYAAATNSFPEKTNVTNHLKFRRYWGGIIGK